MQIKSDAWLRISPLLDEALDLQPGDRAMWLASIEGSHPGDVRLLRILLNYHEALETSDFLSDLPQLALDQEPALPPPENLLTAGLAVGPYILDREIGRGGMATVWLANRLDDGPKRKVAVKIPHVHLLSIEMRQRFERERDLLATLSHPNIAALYDAGISDSGYPYLAMEWIDGLSITEYCRGRRLATAQRLELFDQVLKAVDYAHTRFIAHRDLKPSNILVTPDGVVKLLDFGIGKLLRADRNENPHDLTVAGGRAITPNYAAPEQIAGEPITTAVDIFAAGVVLFELLTGSRPFDRPLRQRALIEEAPLASQRVTPEGAACLPASADLLRKELRGDLDAILAKSLEFEPSRRYQTAGDFADDLRAHREHRPVAARRISRLEWFGKFVKRHRAVTALTTALVVFLLVGSAGFAWEAAEARAAAARAVAEAARAETVARREKGVKDFLVSVFSASDPRIPSEKPRGEITAGQLLDASSQRIQETFANDPETEIELLGTVTDIYHSIEDYDRYGRLHPTYLGLMRKQYGESDPRVLKARLDEAHYLLFRNDAAGAGTLLEQTGLAIRQAGLERSIIEAQWLYMRAEWLKHVAEKDPERKAALEGSIALYAALSPHSEDYAEALNGLGGFYFRANDNDNAVRYVRQAIEVLQSTFGADYAVIATGFANLASAEEDMGRFDPALQDFEKALAVAEKSYGPGSIAYRRIACNYARLLHRRGQRDRAFSMYRSLNADRLEVLGPELDAIAAQPLALTHRNYGQSLLAEGRPSLAIPQLEWAIRTIREHPLYSGDLEPHLVELALAQAYMKAGRKDAARRALISVVAAMSKSVASDDPDLLNARESLGSFLQSEGDARGAKAQFDMVLMQGRDRTIAAVARAYADLAELSLRKGDVPVAMDLSARAVDIAGRATGEPDLRMPLDIARVRAAVLLRAGNRNEAAGIAKRALAEARGYDDPSSPRISQLEAVLRTAIAEDQEG